MRGSHGLPPSLLGPIGKRFRRQAVPHVSTPEACPTRIRKVLRLGAPLAPVPKAQYRRIDRLSQQFVSAEYFSVGDPFLFLCQRIRKRLNCS